MLRVPIDATGRYGVEVERAGDALALRVAGPERELRSALRDAIAREIAARLDDEAEARSFEGGELRAPAGVQRVALSIGREGASFGSIGRVDEGVRLLASDPLSPFETRFLAENGHPHPAAPTASRAPGPTPTTDLHTHFAGCVRAGDLVAIGADHGAAYAPALLRRMGVTADGDAPVAVSALPLDVRARVARWLAIPDDVQTTFAGLEEVYALRAPITKHTPALPALLGAIARDYAAMGVAYAELSLANVVESRTLTVLHEALPAIEASTGVTLRFLAALSRHDDLEWDLDLIDRLGDLAGSRYLVGVDFMGHETNSTRAFAPQLRAIGAWATRARPGLVVRVHAGESAAHPENVRVALEETEHADVELRIGHGLYGVDDRTLDAIAARGVLVEFNLGSNYALNNVQSAREIPLLRYLARGARVVLGTDGYGIFGTTPALEARTARLFGATPEDLARMRATEGAYVARQRAREALLPATFDVPADRAHVHFTPDVMGRSAREKEDRRAVLDARLAERGVTQVPLAALPDLTRGRRVVAIGGAWRQSYGALTEGDRARVARILAGLLDALAPEEAIVVAGGTRDGVEGTAQRLARDRGFEVIGALTATTPPEAVDDALTYAAVVSETLYDKAGELYPALRALDAACVFFGGGSIVSDEIRSAENLRARVLLLDDIGGASGVHARERPDRAFHDVDDLLRKLRAPAGRDQPYRYVGANPTVDVVVARGAGPDAVLLILRDLDAATEAGKWALPGGFVRSAAAPGGPWAPGVEGVLDAALRELREETAVDLVARAAELLEVGVFERGGRDPRDTPSAWSRSHAFTIALDETPAFVAGGDDARDARWFSVDALPVLAFDHARIVAASQSVLRAVRLKTCPKNR